MSKSKGGFVIALGVAAAIGIANGAQALAQSADDKATSFRTAVWACLRGSDTLLRQCLEKLPELRAAASSTEQRASPSADSQWISKAETDKLDGSTKVYVALRSSDRVSTGYGIEKEATLVARCTRNVTEVYIQWPNFVGIGNAHQVKWRVDNQPVATEWWTPSADGQAVFASAPIPFLKKLFGAHELVLSVATFSKLAASVTFPAAGAENAIKPLREVCKW